MANVLYLDTSGGTDAYVSFELATPLQAVWVEVEVYFTGRQLRAYRDDPDDASSAVTSGQFINFRDGSGSNHDYLYLSRAALDTNYEWPNAYGWAPVDAGAGPASSWHTIQMAVDFDFGSEAVIDGDTTSVTHDVAGSHLVSHVRFGQLNGSNNPDSGAYIRSVKVGTTQGGSDLFTTSWASGIPGDLEDTGAVSVVAESAITAEAGQPQGVSVAFDDVTLEPDPLWTRLDSTDNLVAAFSIDRGRNYELDKVGTGTATVTINDVTGMLDPTNSSGPYYGQIQPMKQAAIALQNPVTDAWTTLFRGYVENYEYDLHPTERFMQLTLHLVDGFDILAAIELQPGSYGDTPPAGSEGDVYYLGVQVNARIKQALDDAGWPLYMREIFTGNVILQATVYSTGSQLLSVIQDAADGEFPGVANAYMAKDGTFTFHGRFARFNPETPGYHIGHWKCGDGPAIRDYPTDRAQIRSLSFERGKDKIINSASATPQNIADADVAGQLVEDTDSIDAYGKRSWSADNLLTFGGIVTNPSMPLAETKLFADYYVNNYKEPRTRINQVTFRPLPPSDPRAAATWALICGVEISDLLEILSTHPGGGGFSESFFVEGISYDVRPLNTDYHDATLTLSLSPQSYFDDNPF